MRIEYVIVGFVLLLILLVVALTLLGNASSGFGNVLGMLGG